MTFTASLAASKAVGNLSAYAATKGAIETLVTVSRRRLASAAFA